MYRLITSVVAFWFLVSASRVGATEPSGDPQAPQPVIRMLVPGFTVRELPVKLTNINDLLYAPDGRLFAAGYDGRIHVLRDRDGDGLEDKIEQFWYQPTLRTPLGMALAPEGLYVVANSKVVLLKDTDGDGRADQEEIIVSGWVRDDGITGGGVDALGLAIDRENNLYFSLGCASFANPYRMKDGKAHYDITSERGTILKVSPDRKTREIFCTGYRFGVNLAFNRHGDLFATDQEGETWLPNGNPRDELNHIRRGKHYGFPPRHPKHLPNVVDELPVVSFGPQHQSTCGLMFNEPIHDPMSPFSGRTFGPLIWRGDALVCGFSRGKLWRVQLVKTPHGYVGRQTLIAQSQMMLYDAALSPRGDLLVSCHAGPPDWGVGPQGEGKLFKINYTGESLAQPVLTWANSPIELRVAFDRSLPPSAEQIAKNLRGTHIEYGEYVRAADRFENLKPPYEVVKQQEKAPRGKLPIVAARLSEDRRTLILTTHPHPQPVHYALSLPMGLVDPAAEPAATMELAYTLHGVEGEWSPEGTNKVAGKSGTHHQGTLKWRGWLPHLAADVWPHFTKGSAEHERLVSLLAAGGSLSFRTTLVPAAGRGLSEPESTLPFETMIVPWAPQPVADAASLSKVISESAAVGNPRRGKGIFFGAVAQCGTCHTMHGEGAKQGPDLSNLSHRDRE
ncbi:MAG: PQQ-dependent sugar dehydrogenase, partial [Candidatus Hydrogenedentales bacterium]